MSFSSSDISLRGQVHQRLPIPPNTHPRTKSVNHLETGSPQALELVLLSYVSRQYSLRQSSNISLTFLFWFGEQTPERVGQVCLFSTRSEKPIPVGKLILSRKIQGGCTQALRELEQEPDALCLLAEDTDFCDCRRLAGVRWASGVSAAKWGS